MPDHPPIHEPPAQRGVIFDLDGTLADTLGDITDALACALEDRVGVRLTPSMVRPHVGDGLSTLIRRMAGTDDADAIAAMVRRFETYYAAHCLDNTVLYSGIPDVLDRLVSSGVALAVLSNKPEGFTRYIVEKVLARWSFVYVAGQVDGRAPKPDPQRALAIRDMMGLRAESIFFVGDSDVDVATARGAGMKSVAVTWGLRDRGQLLAADPDHLVDTPAELLRILQPG